LGLKARDFMASNPSKLGETARAADSWKHEPQARKGKTPRAKVEGGTGFKVKWRHDTVYQRTTTGIASNCEKQRKVSKAGRKAPPETPVVGEHAKDPIKESAYAGEVLLGLTQVKTTW
jgi:hypothetical protein